jgi:hypothetical protein
MNFNKDQFVVSGITGDVWVHYDNQFVGRFKHGSAKASANHFVKFLIKNFTVEEYFAKMEQPDSAPVRILEEKGYVSYNITKLLKKEGYPQTREAFKQYLDDRRRIA